MAHAGSSLALGGLIAAGSAFGLRATVQQPSPPSEPPATARAAEPDYDAEYGAYVALLTRVLRGERDAGNALIEAGARLCRLFERCDAEVVARYYVGLTDEELAAGRRADAQYRAIWEEVRDGARQGLSREDWDLLREELVDELRAFVERVLDEADFAPAGSALSLLARLDVDRVERDPRVPAEPLLASAEDLAKRSLDVFERAGMLTPTLEPLWTLARVDRKRGELGRARQSYDELLELSRHVRNETYRRYALRGLIYVAQGLGDVHEIDRLLQELVGVPSSDDRWFVANKHARNLIYRDEPEAALGFLMTRRPAEDEPEQLREWNVLVAGARLRLGNLHGARAAIEAVDEQEVERPIALARVALREREPERVVGMLADEAFQSTLELNQLAEALSVLAEAQLALGEPGSAVLTLERAFAAAEEWRLRSRSSAAGEDVVNLVGEVVGVHAVVLLARAHAELGNALEAARVIEELQSCSLNARERPPAPEANGGGVPDGNWGRTVDAQDVLAWAGAYELGLITWVVGADDSLVVHVAPDGDALAASLPHGRRRTQEAVRRLREALLAGNLERATELGAEVRRALIPDALVERLVPPASDRSGGARLLCLLHGPLEELPIEALVACGALDERIVPLVLPGLPAAEPGALEPADLERWTLLGDPQTDGVLPELPGAHAELGDLEQLLDDTISSTGPEFDREALQQALGGDRALHVATHFVPDAERGPQRLGGAGLLLSESEVFWPRDVHAAAPRLPLVALSACESHTGRFLDAEGLLGVARAFLEAGTRNLLVTLWPVEDGAAHEYALAFHRALREGRCPSRAAAAARDELRREGFEPADWAAFRLVGRD